MSQINDFKVGIHVFAWAYKKAYESLIVSYFQLNHFKATSLSNVEFQVSPVNYILIQENNFSWSLKLKLLRYRFGFKLSLLKVSATVKILGFCACFIHCRINHVLCCK